ncbi:hypothetical protein M2480_002049 [Parabacteroides sp. PFB2-12]|uniref:hypothetical protein n=1 Tax=unclassified Parabacteroides TaxID=2649774 RepID=UPI00247715A1|nr:MULTISPECIES: hypothetical protein [unclassified Parabacteroides]MDH6342925.1 hypothetical protein [Parabacteroides sp. PM6-13]MDH6391060.1 hypothetical protein [Parabacteroides sp. PFB2-12]
MASEEKVKRLIAHIQGNPIDQHTITVIDNTTDGRGKILQQVFCDHIGEDIIIEVIDKAEQVDD